MDAVAQGFRTMKCQSRKAAVRRALREGSWSGSGKDWTMRAPRERESQARQIRRAAAFARADEPRCVTERSSLLLLENILVIPGQEYRYHIQA